MCLSLLLVLCLLKIRSLIFFFFCLLVFEFNSIHCDSVQLPGIAKMFSNEMTLASAWLHLLAVDLFAAR